MTPAHTVVASTATVLGPAGLAVGTWWGVVAPLTLALIVWAAEKSGAWR